MCEIDRLTVELEDAAEATGVAGVDKPMTLVECIQYLRAENKEMTLKIAVYDEALERHGLTVVVGKKELDVLKRR